MELVAKGLSGQLYFDGQSVTIMRRGFLPWMLHGSSGRKSIPLKAITAVQHRRCGFYKGYLQLSVQGELESAGGRHSGEQNLVKDENTVVFYFAANAAFQEMADTLRNAVRDAASAGGTQPARSAAGDVMAQIEELGRLRDAGYITGADFEAKKQEMLGRI